ncbi:hypothetical protein Tdes44962_MAKER08835 [Teratosphaeria destructans]|uniref:Uncharacterized protein n=1 Tax=Teratosphaeria destructans TaxID=418781 RepID=A0A9W7SUS7_9PEZI|nr:hypothetical protein Tdes44962_MAKER08835 [Teratosphaeria destructans]
MRNLRHFCGTRTTRETGERASAGGQQYLELLANPRNQLIPLHLARVQIFQPLEDTAEALELTNW